MMTFASDHLHSCTLDAVSISILLLYFQRSNSGGRKRSQSSEAVIGLTNRMMISSACPWTEYLPLYLSSILGLVLPGREKLPSKNDEWVMENRTKVEAHDIDHVVACNKYCASNRFSPIAISPYKGSPYPVTLCHLEPLMDIHRCRFVPYPPSAINALAFTHPSCASINSKASTTPQSLRLAIGRASGDIEIWNPSGGHWNQESILRSGKDRSIEGLAWVQDPEDVDRHGYKIPGKLRLFSIGYSTSVTEWDLAAGKPKKHAGGNYGEIWCMAAQPKTIAKSGRNMADMEMVARETQKIAVGCADGTLVLISTDDGDLQFSKLVARSSKKGARVLSMAFQNRSTLIAGYADSTIRVYDIRNGHQLRNMTLGAGPKGGPREILVWSVRCLSDGSIISGDSTGTMCFWDGKTYALNQRIRAHDADILDVAVSANGQSAFSGGMDRKTICYKRSGNGKAGEKSRWAKISHSRLHEHDVKAMAVYESKSLSILASGGQ